MAIELTTASQETLDEIRRTLGGAGLSGDETFVGLKDFSGGVIVSPSLSSRDNTFFNSVTGQDMVVKNDTVMQNLTVLGDFVSEIARFFTPADNFYIDYDGQVLETFVLTPLASNYTPQVFLTKGVVNFTSALESFNRSFEGSFRPIFDKTYFNIGGIDILKGDINIGFIPSLKTINLTSFRVLNNFSLIPSQNLEDLDFPLLEAVEGNFEVTDPRFTGVRALNPSLSSINIPQLKFVGANLNIGGTSISLGGYATLSLGKLSTFRANNLLYVGSNLNVLRTSATEISFNNLQVVYGSLTIGGNDVLRKADFPLLNLVNGLLLIQGNPRLAQIQFPNLEFILGGYLGIGGYSTGAIGNGIVQFSAPKLKEVNGIIYSFPATLAALDLGFTNNNLRRVGGEVNLGGAALPTSQIDTILNQLYRLNGVGGTTTRFENQTVRLSAAGGQNQPPSFNGGVTIPLPGTAFTKLNNVVTVDAPNHGLVPGKLIDLELTAFGGGTVFDNITRNFMLTAFVERSLFGLNRNIHEVETASTNQFTYRTTSTENSTETGLGGIVIRTTNQNNGFQTMMLLKSERNCNVIIVYPPIP